MHGFSKCGSGTGRRGGAGQGIVARRRRAARVAVATAAGALATTILSPDAAQGAPFVWDRGGATFNWGDATNWNPDGVPGSGTAPSTGADDTVTFSDLTAANVGIIDLGAASRAVAQVTLSGDTPSAYSLSNGTLVVPLISRATPDQNNFTQNLALSAPASGNIEVNNTNTTPASLISRGSSPRRPSRTPAPAGPCSASPPGSPARTTISSTTG